MRGFGITIATALLASAAGCASGPGQNSQVDWVAAGQGRVRLIFEDFQGATPRRVQFADIWQTEEYALFQGINGAQAEILFAAADESQTVALEYDLTFKRMIDTWNHNSKHRKKWGDGRRAAGTLGTVFFRPYRLTVSGRPCFGFARRWDDKTDDPYLRPGKVLFGYYCAGPGEEISAEKIQRFFQGLVIRSSVGHNDARANAGSIQEATGRAAEFARGFYSSGETGNLDFPFRFARFYNPGGGDRLK